MWRDSGEVLSDADVCALTEQASRELGGSSQGRQHDGVVYHYTTEKGLRGILESEDMWATDYRFTNDEKEVVFGEDLVEQELAALIDEHPDSARRGRLFRLVAERRQGQRLVDMAHPFVASFTLNSGSLKHWGEYGDRAKGYAIGFRSLPLPTKEVELDFGSDTAVDYQACIYDESEFRKRARSEALRIAADFETYVNTFGPQVEEPVREHAIAWILAKFGSLVPFAKHGSFWEENEWRLLLVGTPKRGGVRDTKYGQANFAKYSLKKPNRMDLAELVAGPRADLELLRREAEKAGYGDVPVTQFESSYRG